MRDIELITQALDTLGFAAASVTSPRSFADVEEVRAPAYVALRRIQKLLEEVETERAWGAGERRFRAEKVLNSQDMPSTHPLWMPWALDCADDVLALLKVIEEKGETP